MTWVRLEYLLKGLFLGLLLFLAAQNPTQGLILRAGVGMAVGLAVGVGLASLLYLRRGLRLLRKPVAFLLFVVLENPLLVYLGVLGGLGTVAGLHLAHSGLSEPLTALTGGLGEGFDAVRGELQLLVLACCLGGGAVLGYGFGEVRMVRDYRYRFGICLVVGGLLATALWTALEEGRLPYTITGDDRPRIGMLLLLAMPFFYVLTFTGFAEESEIEIAMICTLLGTGVHLIGFNSRFGGLVGFLVPVTLYFVYVTRFLNGLRIFKHVVRGHCFLRMNRLKPALRAARRALQLDPRSVLGNQLMWAIHQDVDLDLAARDNELLELLDLNRCTNRVAMLLVGSRPPGESQRVEAGKLLHLVEKQAPGLLSHVLYYRAVLHLHERQLDDARNCLEHLLDPARWRPDDPHRGSILFSAWQLVLLVHPAMRERVGEPQLRLPGRRIDAIQAAERRRDAAPQDADMQSLRDRFYGELTAQDYFAAARQGRLPDFDYSEVGQRGAALLPGQDWERGIEYLQILCHGIPEQSPRVYSKIAEVYQLHARPEQAQRTLQQLKSVGLEVGPQLLPEDQRETFFAVVKQLADAALLKGDYDEAIEDLSIATQQATSGKETLRKLAEAYAARKDVLEALRVTEKASLYGSDADLQAKKDSYYYSVNPEQLTQARDAVKGFFDVNYCIQKAKALLDSRSEDLDLLDWAEHLATLALVMQPGNLVANVCRARCHLRRGETDAALKLLEDVREMKPSGNDESDAWYFTVKQLGLLYLDTFARPDLAVGCFKAYQESIKAGADTHYHLGRAYEALRDSGSAIKHYTMVTNFEEHPLRWDAEEAIRRVKAGVAAG